MNNVSEKTHTLVQRWIAAKREVARASAQKTRAECDLVNATNELGVWLVPKEQPPDQMFNIWFGSGILKAQKLKNNGGDYAVSWLREPDGKDRIEFGC